MKKVFVFILFFSSAVSAHPGIAIVKDSKGTIYYSDLQQVWKIKNGQRTIAVPNVHTHELYIDSNDNLYGEHLRYAGEGANRFYHYLWVLQPNGNLDTLFGPAQAYLQNDYSLARDIHGSSYFIKQSDSNHIIKKLPDGRESIFAAGSFAGVNWLHPQKDGSLLFILHNNVYRVDSTGRVSTIAKDIASKNPSFAFAADNRMAWGIWQDDSANTYVAVFSDQVVRKISPDSMITDVYKSTGNWTPLHGVFDNKNQLWVLETSDKNEVRVVAANSPQIKAQQQQSLSFTTLLIAGIGLFAIVVCYLLFRMKHKQLNKI